MDNSQQIQCPQCGDQLDTNLDGGTCFNCNPNAARSVRNNNKWDSSSDSLKIFFASSAGFLVYFVTATIGITAITLVNIFVPPGLKITVFIIIGVVFCAISYAIKDALNARNNDK